LRVKLPRHAHLQSRFLCLLLGLRASVRETAEEFGLLPADAVVILRIAGRTRRAFLLRELLQLLLIGLLAATLKVRKLLSHRLNSPAFRLLGILLLRFLGLNILLFVRLSLFALVGRASRFVRQTTLTRAKSERPITPPA
jgi:hypothetical protein